MIEAFDELSDTMRNNDEVVYELDKFLPYFEDTYISWSQRNSPRLETLFATDLWNMIIQPLKNYRVKITIFVDNKAEGRISKRVFQENKARQISRKTNIS